MPNIVYDVKLDFKDVLLRPKRSTLKSRADVSSEFHYRYLLLYLEISVIIFNISRLILAVR